MIEPEFNLLDEPWITASDLRGNEAAVSLKEALLRAGKVQKKFAFYFTFTIKSGTILHGIILKC